MADKEIIDYEKKILKLIEKVEKNYSVDYRLTEEEQNEYFLWIDSKNAILNNVSEESNEESQDDYYDSEIDLDDDIYLSMKFGTFEEAKENGDILVVKAKITPSYNNKATINQNNFNVEDIVKNQVGNKYKEIQYWAVADMEDGSESKVVSFTIGENVIQKILNNSIP